MTVSIAVLVVDDSQTVRSIVVKHLNNLGYTDIDVAEDGQSALDKIKSKHYGLLISDWEMPQLSGEQFLKEARQKPGYTKVPIIMITATTTRGASWLAGANAFLRKPFTEGDLQKAIKTATSPA
jgi:two-component system, chemotaxis family, chemotaxis protein CheY